MEHGEARIDLLPHIVWECAGRDLRTLNARWIAYTGLSIADALAQGWASAVHPEDLAAIDALLGGRDSFVARIRVRRTDGAWRWNEARGERVASQEHAWIGTLTDVHDDEERSRAEQTLARVGELTRTLVDPGHRDELLGRLARSIVEHLADACTVQLRDVLGRVRCVAAAPAQSAPDRIADLLRGESDCDGPEPPPHGLFHVLRTGETDLVSEVTPELLRALARSEDAARVLAGRGVRSWIVAPLVTRGAVSGALILERRTRSFEPSERALVGEIARRASAAIENAELLAEAQRANQIKDDFLSVASHELRTPLSTILGWSKLLRDDPSPDLDRVKKGLEVIHRNAAAQARLVDDILDTSRILRNKIVIEPKTVAVGVPIEEAIEGLRGAAADKELEVAVEIDPGAVARIDTARLRQVFYNLISNAVKFTPRGGRVAIRVAREPGTIIASVSDTGAGIDPGYLPFLFERFRQADASPTRRHGGLGLGLAIASRLVSLHGGTLVASSEGLGKGATFTVRLPDQASRSEPGTSPGLALAPRGGRSPDLDGVRVLLVDEHDDARDLYGSMLALRGARIKTARSTVQARDILARARFDALISDIAMPGQDGRALARFAREHDPAMCRVAISAFSQPEDLASAKEAGFERYLVKPIDAHELVATIAELVRARA